jgi:threonine dehydratase
VGEYNFPILQRYVDRVVTVSDDQLVQTMKFFAERMKMVVEPTGCLAAAAVLQNIVAVKGKRVGVLVSGGNVDMARYAHFLA